MLGAGHYARSLEVNVDRVSKLRYVISQEYDYNIQPMGWAIEEYSFTNLPVGMSINGSRLSINSQAIKPDLSHGIVMLRLTQIQDLLIMKP